MKFWELVSLFRDDRSQLQRILQMHFDGKYADWLQDFGNIVAQQQRKKLDEVMPIEPVSYTHLRAHET